MADLPPWTMGFTGAIVKELAYWVEEKVIETESKTICVPFLGSAKAMSLLGGYKDMIIESWDTQYIVRLIIDGVFAADTARYSIKEPKLKKGYVYNERPFDHIGDKTAGLIDYIASESTDFEKVALVTAIARSTYRGRIGMWSQKDEVDLWEKFIDRRDKQALYVNLPGTFIHHEADFYTTMPDKEYDLLYIDPPKIVSTTDIYSETFSRLNKSVSNGRKLLHFDKWTKYDYTGRIRNVLKVQSKYFIFVYTSDVLPGLTTLETIFEDYGTLIEKGRFTHRKRMDYGLLYERSH